MTDETVIPFCERYRRRERARQSSGMGQFPGEVQAGIAITNELIGLSTSGQKFAPDYNQPAIEGQLATLIWQRLPQLGLQAQNILDIQVYVHNFMKAHQSVSKSENPYQDVVSSGMYVEAVIQGVLQKMQADGKLVAAPATVPTPLTTTQAVVPIATGVTSTSFSLSPLLLIGGGLLLFYLFTRK